MSHRANVPGSQPKPLSPEERDARIAKVQAWRQEMVATHGFVTDNVFPAKEGGLWNHHTHGIAESFNHPDFQVVLGISPDTVHAIFWTLVERIKAGERFEDGKDYAGLFESSTGINDMKARMKLFTEGNRQVLRVILPDRAGNLDPDKLLDERYRAQYDPLPE